MKQQWERLAGKIDALSLRERGILFVVLALSIIFLVNHLAIEPQFARQKLLSDRIKQEQLQITALQVEIGQRLAGQRVDPDAEIRQRLASARQTLAQIDSGLRELQKNLVRPEKMTALLEGILQRNRKLQLLSLKNLPVSNLLEAASESGLPAKTGAAATAAVTRTAEPAGGAIYKHEVEIVLQGSYPDMLNYMRELEQLPEQVYWSRARLAVDDYPKATLSLKLFTLSLDKAWLDL